MEDLRVVVVGEPTFRHDVAQALGINPQEVTWARTIEAVEHDDADIIALSTEVDTAKAIDFAESTARLNPTASLILVRGENQNGILPTLMRAGFRDVIDLSKEVEGELKQALERAVEWTQSFRTLQEVPDTFSGPQGTVITVFSSKGGTGKSFLAANLAAAFADRTGCDTALLDLDLDMGDLFSYYGTEPARSIHDLLKYDKAGDRWIIPHLTREEIRASATNLGDHLFGFGSPSDPGAEKIDPDAIKGLLAAMRGAYDIIVVDAPADYSDQIIVAVDVSDAICLVAGLDVVGIKHLSKGLDTLLQIGVPRDHLRIVLNRADSKVGLSPEDVEKVLDIHIDSMVPSSRLVPMSLNKGVPTYIDEPKSDVAQAVGAFADRLRKSLEIPDKTEHEESKRRLFRKKA